MPFRPRNEASSILLHFLIYQFIYLSRIFNQAGPVQLRAVLNLDLLHLSHSFSFFFQFIFLLFIFRTKCESVEMGQKKKHQNVNPFP